MKHQLALLCSITLLACGDGSGQTAASTTNGVGDEGGLADSQPTSPQDTDSDVASGETTAGESSTSGGDPGGGAPLPPISCPDDFNCTEDLDQDGVPIDCDNAPDHYNPQQADSDFDSFGDLIDLCPTVQGLSNTADSDRDGVGNACDVCGQPTSTYADAGFADLPVAFAFAALPDQADADGDGVGDVCDNCVTVPNCFDLGPSNPHEVGSSVDVTADNCQDDSDGNYVGDACEGLREPGAAGVVGFRDIDDFDQDGLTNAVDSCPRQPVAAQSCGTASDCPANAPCADGVCGHVDSDGDGRGNICDNCPATSNPSQADADSDSVGDACETAPECASRHDPRAFGFYDVSVTGWCCTTTYDGGEILDPDGRRVGEDELERLGVGVVSLPPGCDEALAQAGVAKATRLTLDDVGDDATALWNYFCQLPQHDQDLDGLGDACDLCTHAYDPSNAPFVDANGTVWETNGAYCSGDYGCSDE